MFNRIASLKMLVTGKLLLVAALLWSFTAHAADDFLPPEIAFKFSAKMADPKTVAVTYTIADGYYMYRERFAFKADGAKLGTPVFPQGKVKFDETFQKNVETYRHSITITMPVEAKGVFTLAVTGQGCADKGLCYAPMESKIKLSPNGKTGLLDVIGSTQDPGAGGMASAGDGTASGTGNASLKDGKLLAVVLSFLVLGLGLSLTPCVWPMLPILSFLIVGEGPRVSRSRGFMLSSVYSLGMALVFTALGVAAALSGRSLMAELQRPEVLSAFAILIVGLALAMFDVYQLQMPSSIQTKLMAISQKQTAGKLVGVFIMGVLSGLIIGPCVTPPLLAALVYISQTHDVVIGGSALFSMAVGMSAPLLVVGVSAGSLLPKAGPWMEEIKRFFGVFMLGTALWILSPVLDPRLQMMGWAVLAGGYGVHLLWTKRSHSLGKVVGAFFLALGLLQVVGVSTGAQDPLTPLAKVTGQPKSVQFKRVKSVAELDAAIQQAGGKTVMLDFYADWCVSCKEMEKLTFSDARIQKQFAEMVVLQADVTANNEEDKALLKRFNLFGPPVTIFFDRQGKEISGVRVVGYQDVPKFSQSLSQAMQS
jgi:thiol:disulfide interchange protein DsbD